VETARYSHVRTTSLVGEDRTSGYPPLALDGAMGRGPATHCAWTRDHHRCTWTRPGGPASGAPSLPSRCRRQGAVLALSEAIPQPGSRLHALLRRGAEHGQALECLLCGRHYGRCSAIFRFRRTFSPPVRDAVDELFHTSPLHQGLPVNQYSEQLPSRLSAEGARFKPRLLFSQHARKSGRREVRRGLRRPPPAPGAVP